MSLICPTSVEPRVLSPSVTNTFGPDSSGHASSEPPSGIPLCCRDAKWTGIMNVPSERRWPRGDL
ncbi:hypothetical protein EYF80_064229 [Liparis tanakae]|uniref:Uncharacterized protein n=1 Tax=Liparis tanakae TaxID=230148 RepID=A0A4Z2EAQ0_9TELE|nr:hypothetical protein EYF80_064229 [Liparis tanakae]